MNISKFQEMNSKRNIFFESKRGVQFDIFDWALAIAGESGELCNLLKKVKRKDFLISDKKKEILQELADIITYCDLAMTNLEANTEEELIDKFKIVSKRFDYASE